MGPFSCCVNRDKFMVELKLWNSNTSCAVMDICHKSGLRLWVILQVQCCQQLVDPVKLVPELPAECAAATRSVAIRENFIACFCLAKYGPSEYSCRYQHQQMLAARPEPAPET